MKLPFLKQLFPSSAPEIAPEKLAGWLKENRAVQLVDVRTASEFRGGAIAGARHAPATHIPASLESLKLDSRQPVVVVCLSGHRSLPATRWLCEHGFEAYSLKGGIITWRAANLPLIKP